MAQTNYTPISLYYSTTASAVPTAANLVQGELAINTNDGKLYYEDSSGVVRVLASKSTGSIGGSTTQVQYNSSGSLAGSANFIFNGTNVGIGVTPNANEFGNILQINQTILNDDNAGTNHLTKNAFYNSGWKYISTDFASKYTQASSVHSWYTAPSGTAGNAITFTQAMTLTASGNLLVGTTSTIFANSKIQSTASSGPTLGIQQTTSSEYVAGFWNNAASSTNFVAFYSGSSGTLVGSITYNGSLTLYNTTSDQRLKTNIVDAPSGNIDSIKIRSFNWVADGSHQEYGMVAQELLEVAPYAVYQPKNSDEMMGVDYSKLVPMMIKEIQDLKQRIASLENK
jgi:hypothetical protein